MTVLSVSANGLARTAVGALQHEENVGLQRASAGFSGGRNRLNGAR